MGEAGTKLADVHAAGWQGPAATAFTRLVGDQPPKFRTAGTAFGQAAGAIRTYAAVLRAAQKDAGRAVALFEDAQAQSQRWRYASTVHADAVRAAQTAGDPPPSTPAPPDSDPAAGDLAASQRLLSDARSRVRAHGRLAAATLAAASENAPDKPGLLSSVIGGVGDALGGAGHVLSAAWTTTGAALADGGAFLLGGFEDALPYLEVALGAVAVVVGANLVIGAVVVEVGVVVLAGTGVGIPVAVGLQVVDAGAAVGGVLLIVGGTWAIQDGISRMGKGGKTNVADTGVVDEANALIRAGKAAGMCAALAQLMDAARRSRDTSKMQKIKATQKAKGCRHKS